MEIREIRLEDADKFLDLCRRLDEETKFMMLEPGERTTTVSEQREKIRALTEKGNQAIFVAECDGKLVGYLGAYGGAYRRNWHSAYIVVGVLRSYTGRGIGTVLFGELEKWAIRNNICRLELTVMVNNERAFNLYRKMGFQIEGRKVCSLLVDDSFVDEYYMAKLLGRTSNSREELE